MTLIKHLKFYKLNYEEEKGMIERFKKYLNNERGGSPIESPIGMVIVAIVVVAVVGIIVGILNWSKGKVESTTNYVDKQYEQWIKD